jgi:hypothetical protein
VYASAPDAPALADDAVLSIAELMRAAPNNARVLAALDREQVQAPLQTMQRLIELERELHRGRGLSIER